MKILAMGLGMNTNKTDVGNYRVVSNFLNRKNEPCFIEISHMEENGVLYGTIRQAYKVVGEKEKHCYRTFDQMYSTKFLYTKENIINIINNLFGCKFDEIEVISRDDGRWAGISRLFVN